MGNEKNKTSDWVTPENKRLLEKLREELTEKQKLSKTPENKIPEKIVSAHAYDGGTVIHTEKDSRKFKYGEEPIKPPLVLKGELVKKSEEEKSHATILLENKSTEESTKPDQTEKLIERLIDDTTGKTKYEEIIKNAAKQFEESASEKKEAFDELLNEKKPISKITLWHKKNFSILKHQKNTFAKLYMEAIDEDEKEKAFENFVKAKKYFDEYEEDKDKYEKEHNWGYKPKEIKTEEPKTKETQIQPTNFTAPVVKEIETEIEMPTQTHPEEDKVKVEEIEKVKEIEILEKPKDVIDKDKYIKKFDVGKEDEVKEIEILEKPKDVTEDDIKAKTRKKYIEIPQEEKPKVLPDEYEPEFSLPKIKEDKEDPFFEISPRKKIMFEAAKKLLENSREKAKQLGSSALKIIESIGNNWNKADKSYKYALVAAALAGGAAGGVAALAGASALLASRVGGSTAIFVAAASALERSRQKKEVWWNQHPKYYGAAIGAAVFLISDYLSSSGTESVSGGAEAPGASAPQTEIKPETISSAASVSEYIVHEGDRLWNIVGEIDGVSELSGAQKENAIANIVGAIRENPSLYGISSGNVDQLTLGDNIDMEKIRGILETKQISGEGIIEHAKNLTSEQIENIDVSREELIDYKIHHPYETITTEKADHILKEAGLGGGTIDLDDSAINNLNESNLNKPPVYGGEEVSVELPREIKDIVLEQMKTLYGGSVPFGWEKFFNENINIPAEDILDNTYLDNDSKEEYLQKYLNQLNQISGKSPIEDINIGKHETIGEYISRVLPDVLEKNPDWNPEIK